VMQPHKDDVIVRYIQREGTESIPVFLLGTTSAPDQFIVPTGDEAVSKALAFAKRSYVRAWLADGDGADAFVLLGTFRAETTE
jgi:hypothetical protein